MEKYEKLKILGRGAHGVVYLCKRLVDNKQVVVKEIPVETKTAEERQAALGEVKLLDLLNHPNVIGYYENFFDQNNLCIVMEYAQGGTLADFIAERKKQLMPESQILRFFAQLCNSLYHLHAKNILHRDIKSQNILLDKTKSICKLSDFGISKLLSTFTKASTVIGTPSYLSPEICEGKPYNKKSDVWSLGCILYELTALRKAFEAETLGSLVMQITRGHIKPVDDQYSEDLKQLILRMFTVDPEQRPTVEEIRATSIVAVYLYDIVDVGGIRCPRLFKSSKTVKLRSSNRSRKQQQVNVQQQQQQQHQHTHTSVENTPPITTRPKLQHCKAFIWECGSFDRIAASLPLPPSKIIIQVSCSSTSKMAVTKDHELIVWEEDLVNEKSINFGSIRKSWSYKIANFTTPVQITYVACGEMFYALITDRGILMTCGSGVNGCLSPAMSTAASLKPRIVEDLVRCEVTKVACGPSHVIAATADHELFGWGKLDDGWLGLHGKDVQSKPRKIPLPSHIRIHSIYCTMDASAFVTASGELWCTGINNHNKLGMWTEDNKNVKIIYEFTKSNLGAQKIDVDLKQSFSIGPSCSAFISERKLYTFGCIIKEGDCPGISNVQDWRPSLVSTQHLTPICAVLCGKDFCIFRTEDHRLYFLACTKHNNKSGRGKDNIELINVGDLSYDSVLAMSTCCSTSGCSIVCVKT